MNIIDRVTDLQMIIWYDRNSPSDCCSCWTHCTLSECFLSVHCIL